MVTYSRDNQLFFSEKKAPESILGDRLIFNPKNIKQSIDYINSKGIKSITINPTYFSVDSLDFLQFVPNIEGLYLLQGGLDINIINSLPKLKALIIPEASGEIDFSNFPNLMVASFTHDAKMKNIDHCKNLFWLWITKYKSDNLIHLKELINLKYLNLYKASIRNLEGIQHMRSLIHIRLDEAPKLESLEGLSSSLENLQMLDIYAGKKLTKYDSLRGLESLQQLELRKTGDTESIEFIKDLPSLKKVTLGFKVLNGKMGYLKEIQSVGFIDFPYYDYKMKDFAK